MPELPEVENVCRSLLKLVKGKTVEDIHIGWPKIIHYPLEIEQFQDALRGQTFRGLNRKGKFLVFELDDYSLVSHLRMEGHYSVHKKGDPSDKHTHVVFCLTDGEELRYRDVRKFGTMHLFKKGTEQGQLPLSKLGPEPFSADFSAEYLMDRLKKTDRIIKAVLLDQAIVAGLGNIYADEVLFRAGIHPCRRAKTITEEEARVLTSQMIETLNEAIEAGGSSVNTYMNSLGLAGSFQNSLHVYGRNGQECVSCGTLLEKIKAAGRGTHFCPSCQIIE
ncbi:DNA-formamidopyrimidine glycosylase [Siminovitchia sp. FSL H7-0308]|uniref:Formamidopyrimidine-DNA glycosylase n=1 Tax=Siminovitchia thermophila TaxID=1245522 RepID=A0ABS2R5A6_9BACI|nr:DNA-formamidopyrimidine glycosylase [Siminovitchia thermophila]MBM7714801.1 formamidopyrimidine-DNA glycosylase [Siminovitchia thermophila]ONK24436.1 DNA-formamidopyrimidine glycosylase [Bacillus sp. VT-16-64]